VVSCLPSPVVQPAMSPQDKLRATAARAAKLPPLQLAARTAVSTRTLVEGGPVVPQRYPNPDQWESDTIPPGSHYNADEWAAARIDSGGHACDVLEIQKKDRAYLVQMVRPQEVITKTVQGGQVHATTTKVMPDGVSSAFSAVYIGMLFSDCIWVTTDSYPQFPEAIESGAHLAVGFKVIRPRTDYLDPARAYRVGAHFAATNNTETMAALSWLDDEADLPCSPEPTGG
jgi:hypothetical protein